MDRIGRSRRQLEAEARQVRAHLDDLLDALQLESAGSVADTRARMDAALRRARIGMVQAKAATRARALRLAGDTDVAVHRHPWRTAGVALAAGLVAGAILGLIASDSRR